jgi:ElaB/YqjD/DUF883 family membrane-anchored ribosome-binding protein
MKSTTTNGHSKTRHAKTKNRFKLKLANGYNLNRDFDSIKRAILSATTNAKKKARNLLTNQVESAKDNAKEMGVNVAHYAKARPFKTIGIAMLTGVCLGFLMRK